MTHESGATTIDDASNYFITKGLFGMLYFSHKRDSLKSFWKCDKCGHTDMLAQNILHSDECIMQRALEIK